MPEQILFDDKRKKTMVSMRTILTFLLTLILCFSLVCVMILNRSNVEKLTMEQLILEKSIKINDVISKLLYKTQMLSSLVLQNDGQVLHFEQIAATIVDDPAILNILIAPSGIVTDVYPLEGNESVINLNFFSEGAGNKEALLAKETGQLVLGGPFNAVQGGQILVGRLPVFTDHPDDTKAFWGLVSVTLKYPQALDGAGLSDLKMQGYAFEIWRVNPDDGERQVIAASEHNYSRNPLYVERVLSIANAEWYFRMFPVRDWYAFPETWISALISFIISMLVAAVVKNNRELKWLNHKLEHLSNVDPLTGIYNRRYFMDTATMQMGRIIRTNGSSFIIIFDLDFFKHINDRYGHPTGDAVLRETAARAAGMLRPYDILARYGGEEFIIFVADLHTASVINLAERIRMRIIAQPIEADGVSIAISASFGIAPAAPRHSLCEAIARADAALYRAKAGGRNQVVFSEDEGITHEEQTIRH